MAEDNSLECRIHTPDGTVFDDTVESLILPGEEGQFGILYNHIPYMALLDTGPIVIEQNDQKRKLACGGGFAEIENNVVTVLADTAEFPESIDRSEVKNNIEELTDKLTSTETTLDDVEREEIEAELRRDKVRINVLDEST
jgi:F-type H+-transporting ATPase subunit epsilon